MRPEVNPAHGNHWLNAATRSSLHTVCCPQLLLFLGTLLGSPSEMTRVKTKRRERWHLGNLWEGNGKKATIPSRGKSKWRKNIDKYTIVIPPEAPKYPHAPSHSDKESEKEQARGNSDVRSVQETLEDRRIHIWKGRIYIGFRVDIRFDSSFSASPYGVKLSFQNSLN